MQENASDVVGRAVTAVDVAKATPVFGMTGLHFMGVSVADWAALLGVAYTLVLFYVLVRDKIIGRKK